MLILNLKTYPQSTGDGLNDILEVINSVVEENPEVNDLIYIAPNIAEIALAKNRYPNLNIVGQNVNALEPGSTTGKIPAKLLIVLGLEFSVLNHSECRVSTDLLNEVQLIQEQGLKLIVCCENLEEAKSLMQLKPFAIALENKELIGSGRSITEENPEEIKEFVEMLKGTETLPIIGAGISAGADVQATLDMGGAGCILASAFVKAEDKKAKLMELITPFIK